MAQSIYGFAQASGGGGSGVTEALRLYQRAISQSANESGVIDNPDVYRQARDMYLAPFADDVRVATKISDSQNDENQLRDQINDASLASSVFKQNVSEVLREYAKQYYQSPDNLVATSTYVYNTAVEELATEIENRRLAGQSYGELQTLLNEYSAKADNMSRLTRQIISGSVQNPDAYGVFIRTNPDDGSIMDISIDTVDSISRQTGFKQTNSRYGEIPVWTNTISSTEKDGTVTETARIGANEFKWNDEKNVLERATEGRFGRRLLSFLPGGETPGEASAAIAEEKRSLNLQTLRFGDAVNLPAGSIMQDVGGNYYYQGSDGVYKATSKDNLQKFLTNVGVSVPDIDAVAYPISRNEANGFGAFTNEDGTSRLIDDSYFNSSLNTSNQQSMLPPLTNPVQGGFSAAATPMSTAQTPASSMIGDIGGGQQPRKPYSVKTDSQVGMASTKDFMAKEGQRFTRPVGTGSLA